MRRFPRIPVKSKRIVKILIQRWPINFLSALLPRISDFDNLRFDDCLFQARKPIFTNDTESSKNCCSLHNWSRETIKNDPTTLIKV